MIQKVQIELAINCVVTPYYYTDRKYTEELHCLIADRSSSTYSNFTVKQWTTRKR